MLFQRVGDRVRHRMLLNFDPHDPIPREKWQAGHRPRRGAAPRPPVAARSLQAAAEGIVARLRAKGGHSEAVQEEARKPDIATVALDTLEHETPRTVGCECLCLKALGDPGFAEILHDRGIKGREGRIARETSRWLRRDSATARRLSASAPFSGATGPPSSGSCSTVSARCSTSPTPSPSTISPTFTTTATRTESSPLRALQAEARRLSPDHAGAGFPRRCEIRPHTASEPGRLEDALARLEAVCGGTAPKPTLVMDAGIASAENILWLGERGYDWIALGRGGEVLLITSAHHERRGSLSSAMARRRPEPRSWAP